MAKRKQTDIMIMTQRKTRGRDASVSGAVVRRQTVNSLQNQADRPLFSVLCTRCHCCCFYCQSKKSSAMHARNNINANQLTCVWAWRVGRAWARCKSIKQEREIEHMCAAWVRTVLETQGGRGTSSYNERASHQCMQALCANQVPVRKPRTHVEGA